MSDRTQGTPETPGEDLAAQVQRLAAKVAELEGREADRLARLEEYFSLVRSTDEVLAEERTAADRGALQGAGNEFVSLYRHVQGVELRLQTEAVQGSAALRGEVLRVLQRETGAVWAESEGAGAARDVLRLYLANFQGLVHVALEQIVENQRALDEVWAHAHTTRALLLAREVGVDAAMAYLAETEAAPKPADFRGVQDPGGGLFGSDVLRDLFGGYPVPEHEQGEEPEPPVEGDEWKLGGAVQDSDAWRDGDA